MGYTKNKLRHESEFNPWRIVSYVGLGILAAVTMVVVYLALSR